MFKSKNLVDHSYMLGRQTSVQIKIFEILYSVSKGIEHWGDKLAWFTLTIIVNLDFGQVENCTHGNYAQMSCLSGLKYY